MAGPSAHPQPSEELQVPSPHTRPQHAPTFPQRPSISTEPDEKLAPPRLDTFPSIGARVSSEQDGPMSPMGQRADACRIDDDLEVLRAERLISNQEHQEQEKRHGGSRPPYRRHPTEIEDTFNPPVNIDPKAAKKRDETAALYRFWMFLRKFPRFIRYFVYLFPGALLLLVPVLLGLFAIDQESNPVGGTGGAYLMWFGIWLEIVWGSLWVSRMITSLMLPLFHGIAKISGSTNAKKWRDVAHGLELHTALFLWLLAVLVSFKPTIDGHRVPIPDGEEESGGVEWIDVTFKVIIAFFVLSALNFAEKIIIQWIASAFHERTYATRIENNKGDIRQIVQLFEHAKNHMQHTDSFWQGSSKDSGGTTTPMRALHENAISMLGKVGQVAGKVGNDFIGRKVDNINHPRKVVAELLRTTSSAHTLARLIYRSLVRDGQEMVYLEDVQAAFKTPEEADAAFNVFDKDLNGDISMEEFEAVCNEIGMEKKAIAASLKDLDSVIKKLDKVFLFIIVVITVIVFISIISGSAAAGLASAGSSILGLAWVLQATAQEFLQSIIFVFVKHPFDVGDRVTIYGSTGANMTGDDYYVTEISLLYTEFKKLEGHVVQAPNSLLNTLFILNQRRSNGLADPVSLKIRFGTPAWMIEELKARMLNFVLSNKRDYQPTILCELTKIEEQRAANMNIIFLHKTNFQSEVIRLGRHNKFMLELMSQMVEIGIQSPFRVEPGGSRDYPMFWSGMQPPPAYGQGDHDHDHDHAHHHHARPQSPDRNLGRARSVTSATTNSQRFVPSQAANAEALATFGGDVFENRREHFTATRLASIREKDRAVEKKQQAKAEDEAIASSSALAQERSHDSHSRARIFGRPRSRSQAPRGSTDIV